MDNIVEVRMPRKLNVNREIYRLNRDHNEFNLAYCEYTNRSIRRDYCIGNGIENMSFSEGLLRVLKLISAKNAAHNAIVFPNTDAAFGLYRSRSRRIRALSLFGARAFGFDKDPRGFMAISYKDNILRSVRMIRNLRVENGIKFFDECRSKYHRENTIWNI